MATSAPPPPASGYTPAEAQMARQTFETAVSSNASIVKPTVPKNVLAEFQHFTQTGSRFGRQNPFDDDEAPSQQPSFPPPQPVQQRRQAPAPPAPQPVLAPLPPQPQRQADFSDFSGFSMMVSTPQQQSSKPVDLDKARLIEAMQQHLRLKAAHGMAMTVGELSGQIRELTGNSWGGVWEAKYGNLLEFLRTNPDAFTVVKSKYVVCKGQEDIANRQIERENQEHQSMLNEQQRMQASYSQVPMMYQQQQQQQSYYAPGFDATNPFGNTSMMPSQQQNYQDSFWEAPSTQSRSNSMLSRKDSNDWNLPSSNGGYGGAYDPFAPIDPFASRPSEAPSYIPAPPNPMGDWWNQPSAMYPPVPQQAPRDPFNFGGFGDSLGLPSAIATPAADTSSQLTEEELEDIRKAERRASRKAKKQEEEDERLARELQEKEFEVASSSRGSDGTYTGDLIVLTTPQMRDLAEKELGIDNVRIIAGFTVKKYGREGRPHQRKMWVTQSLTHLAWASSLLEGSHRGIELKHVNEVTSGQMTPTIARSTSDKNKVRAQCFSLVTMSRTLDLQACSVIQRDALVNALRAVVAFNQKYKPEKVDRDLTRVRAVGHANSVQSKN